MFFFACRVRHLNSSYPNLRLNEETKKHTCVVMLIPPVAAFLVSLDEKGLRQLS